VPKGTYFHKGELKNPAFQVGMAWEVFYVDVIWAWYTFK